MELGHASEHGRERGKFLSPLGLKSPAAASTVLVWSANPGEERSGRSLGAGGAATPAASVDAAATSFVKSWIHF